MLALVAGLLGGAEGARAEYAAPSQAPIDVSAQALIRQPNPQNAPDVSDPVRDAVGHYIGCTVTLITPEIVLTAGHCVPEDLRAKHDGYIRGDACPRLPQQSQLQGNGWEEPLRWYPLSDDRPVRFGNLSDAPLLEIRPAAYSSPRCADMALIRLGNPVPEDIAVPMPVLTTGTPGGTLPRGGPLRHVGWGGYLEDPPPSAFRGTGPVDYWGENNCVIVAIPPLRTDGKRLASGDSGGPLLMQGKEGEEVVAGVLFVIGQPDREVCGSIQPRPRLQHGSWTPTFRGPIRGTLATPIGSWLRAMVPEADHR
ncbi:MAG: hypothetical protein AAGG09_13635 [Pseudomonadota bacterium]